MKKLIATFTLFGLIYFTQPAAAQVRVGVQVNIGAQPTWGPTGYDYAEYYYMPDIDVYYNVPRRQFVYLDGGHWCFGTSLPVRYRSYDLYRGYKVVINDRNPYMRGDYYRGQYRQYKGWYGRQVVIRDAPRPRPGYGHNDRNDRHDRYDRRGRDNRNDRNDRHDRRDRHDNDRGNNHGRH